ncbi:hypothetical protein AV521_36715 [Streptomyces sp. IMTB 2501]|nr:hypothetical protein AV521_36715 [Streptomyces sp. IMTB 2501]
MPDAGTDGRSLPHGSRSLDTTSDQDSHGSGPLNLNLLRTFLAVHRLGSFTAAARRLGLSQSTVTTQIRALENRLGHELFETPGAGCHPAASGGRARDAAVGSHGPAGRHHRRGAERPPGTGAPDRIRTPTAPGRAGHKLRVLGGDHADYSEASSRSSAQAVPCLALSSTKAQSRATNSRWLSGVP